jgi:hypothetical protein
MPWAVVLDAELFLKIVKVQRPMHYFTFHIGDYAKNTAHLSFLEEAIYFRLLRRYYDQEQPMPDDVRKVARMAGCPDDDAHEKAVSNVSSSCGAMVGTTYGPTRTSPPTGRRRRRTRRTHRRGRKPGGEPLIPSRMLHLHRLDARATSGLGRWSTWQTCLRDATTRSVITMGAVMGGKIIWNRVRLVQSHLFR